LQLSERFCPAIPDNLGPVTRPYMEFCDPAKIEKMEKTQGNSRRLKCATACPRFLVRTTQAFHSREAVFGLSCCHGKEWQSVHTIWHVPAQVRKSKK
jgi:hypothetical protein